MYTTADCHDPKSKIYFDEIDDILQFIKKQEMECFFVIHQNLHNYVYGIYQIYIFAQVEYFGLVVIKFVQI